MIFNMSSGTAKKVPILDDAYPQNATVVIAKSATFEVKIAEDGKPNAYTYQWYVNDNAIEGATNATFTRTGTAVGTENIFCIVTNKAGSVQSKTCTLTVSPEYIVSGGQFVDGNAWNKYLNADEHSSIDISGGSVHMHVNSSGTARVWTSNKYDFTGKNILKVNCTFDTASGAPGTMGVIYFGACDTLNDDSFVAQTAVAGHDGNSETVSVDVSNISGLHYLKIVMIRATDHADVIYSGDIWFE